MKKKICYMIPEEEKQCVWMTSGLISYKLCTRDYRCEECIFDQVIRNEAVVDAAAQHGEAVSAAASLCIPDSLQASAALFYHSGHCWAKVEDADQVRIGIDGILAQIVSPLKTVVLPQAGDAVVQGQCFAHIIQQKHIVELVSPLTGTVLSVNQGLKTAPQALTSEPWGQGWLVTIRPDNLEHDLKSLMFGRKAMEWYQRKEHEVAMTRVDMLSRHEPELGPTLQDGGDLLASLADMLSPGQYEQIIDSLFRPEDAA
jgi:glycine cleavage system H protein